MKIKLESIRRCDFYFTIFLLISFVICGILLGVIPFLGLPSLGINITLLGKIGDIAVNKGIFDFQGDNILYPYGYEPNEGFGIIFIAKCFIKLGVSDLGALSITYFIFYLISFVALIILLIKIINVKSIALCMTLVYFISPFLLAQSGIPYVYFGIMILPLSVLCDYYIFIIIFENEYKYRLSELGKYKNVLYLLIASFFVRLLISSIGWYTAVITATGSCLFFLIYNLVGISKINYKNRIKNYLFFLIIPWIIGMFLILLITPKGASSFSSEMTFYNGNSVDIISLFFPDSSQAISALFPSTSELVGKGENLTGDGTMWKNYLGYTFIITSFILMLNKKHRTRSTKSLAITGIIGLILSLGPGIKVLSTVPQNLYPTYNLSFEKVFDLPWKYLYLIFPLKSMRAVYRWILLPKFILLLLSSIFLGNLYKCSGKKKMISIAFCLICVLEFLPMNLVYGYINSKYNYYNMALEIEKDTILELDNVISKDGAKVAICSYDYDSNGFLVTYIAQELNIKTYAGASDKAIATAKKYIPDDITNLQKSADPEEIAKFITNVNEKGICDYILLPHFALRESSYWWPATDEVTKRTKMIAVDVKDLLVDVYQIYETEHYTIIDISNRDNKGRFDTNDISHDKINNFKLIDEKKIFSSNKAISLNQKHTYVANIQVPDGDDRIFILSYLRSIDSEYANLNISMKLLDNDLNVIKTIEPIVHCYKDYIKYEDNFTLNDGTAYVELILSADNEIAIKNILAQSYSSKSIFKGKNVSDLEKIGFNNIISASQVHISNGEASFLGDSYIKMDDDQTISGSYIEIGMDLWLNSNQKKADDSRIITKWGSWKEQMSFSIASKLDSYAIIFSNNGSNWEGIFLEKNLIPVEQWTKLMIIFDEGLVSIYVNDKLINEKQMSFKNIYNGNKPITIGQQMEGKIRDFYYLSD